MSVKLQGVRAIIVQSELHKFVIGVLLWVHNTSNIAEGAIAL